MKKILLILLLCGTAFGQSKIDDVLLPYWKITSDDPNQMKFYVKSLVSELQDILDNIRNAVNTGIDLSGTDAVYFGLPGVDGLYADDTWRLYQVSADDFEIQKKVDGTWTKIAKWSYADGQEYIDVAASGTVSAPAIIASDLLAGSSTFGTDPNYITIDQHGTMSFYGDARYHKHLVVGAGSFKLGATAPTAGYETIFPTLAFGDGSDDQAHYATWVPFRWDDTTDMTLMIHWQHDTLIKTGKVLWNLTYFGVSAGEDPAGAGTTISQLSAGNHLASSLIETEFTTKILASNLSRMDDLGLLIWRNGDDGTDTLTEAAELVAVHIHYIENQLGDPIKTYHMLLEDGTEALLEDGGFLILEGV